MPALPAGLGAPVPGFTPPVVETTVPPTRAFESDPQAGLLLSQGSAQPTTDSNIITGGAFRRAREAGANLVEADKIRLDLLEEVSHSNANRRIRALESAQANGNKSPFISTTLDRELALKALQKARAEGRDVELVTIRGPYSSGVDFEATFDALGGRKSPSRLKDVELKEYGVPDLLIPPHGQSKSGFFILERE